MGVKRIILERGESAGRMSKFTVNNIKKTIRYCRKNGWKKAFFAAAERIRKGELDQYVPIQLSQKEIAKQKEAKWMYAGKISILVPAYETKKEYLKEMIESVLSQTYSNWELVIADASHFGEVEDIVGQYCDQRIIYEKLKENGGIAENSNHAMKLCTGEYVGLLDHDDIITRDALYEIAKTLETPQKPDFIYSDEDKVDGGLSHYFEPHFKTDFNLDLFLSNNYICHFSVIKASLLKELGFRKEYDGAQDYDLFLRLVAKIRKDNKKAPFDEDQLTRRIVHVSKVLYHWRCHAASTAENPESKRYAYEAGKRALQDFAEKQGWNATAEHIHHLGFYRLQYEENGSFHKIASIFHNRPDIVAVCGNRVKRGRIACGAMGLDGLTLYGGLPIHFSGYMHRAALQQDVPAAHPGCMVVRDSLLEEYEDLLKRSQAKTEGEALDMQFEFCMKIRENGGRILYDPQFRPMKGSCRPFPKRRQIVEENNSGDTQL